MRYHLTVLAMNMQGYQNLMMLSTKANLEGMYYKPRVDHELLEQYGEGLIILSGCASGEVGESLRNDDYAAAKEVAGWYKGVFGDRYYLELQDHGHPESATHWDVQAKINEGLKKLAKELAIPMVVTCDGHYLNHDYQDAHEILLCVGTGSYLSDEKRMSLKEFELHLTDPQDIIKRWGKEMPEVITNTKAIADRCNIELDLGRILIPKYPVPEGETEHTHLTRLVYTGLAVRYLGMAKDAADALTPETIAERLDSEARERAKMEMDVMANMGYEGYFLIVQDFIRAAREELDVSVGPGRGSAAGSAVAYCLGITKIDPIAYDLLFERFLNPDRISLPDIDVDFDDDGRGRVLNWVTEKYGQEKVAHIITYGTMATKLAIKDVARVQKLPLSESDRLCKLVPDKIPDKKMNLPNAIAYVPELQAAEVSPDPILRDTIKYAKMLEGNVRNTGVHACGTIICRDDITDWVPVSTADDKETGEKMLVTQYEGSVIEDTGLIKMDFLGLKTLSIIKEAIENIKHSKGIILDIDEVDISDPPTYALYSEGRTIGTFQFESAGMQKYLRELEPSTFEDLIAMNALYRPGPMDYIPDFIDRKHGRKPIEYDIPIMEKYLKDTYGITVYQEQVMLLSRLLADFTRGESDALRKAMGKKLRDKLDHMKPKFIEGGRKNGHDPKVLEKIWTDWEKFASYAFNKSHATCYSWVAYQTAFLKANYPAEYMAATMSRNISNITEITKLMDESKATGIMTKGPDVNESYLKFSVNRKGDIRFGLGAIKGVGESAVQSILEERERNGEYKDIFDFVQRVNLSACNRKNIENLALAGAFDSFTGIKREDFFVKNAKDETFTEVLVRYGNKYQMDKAAAANSLFGGENQVDIAYIL
jgi:DNA polymerase-3 subunit alpha